jgi:hypothetical protein
MEVVIHQREEDLESGRREWIEFSFWHKVVSIISISMNDYTPNASTSSTLILVTGKPYKWRQYLAMNKKFRIGDKVKVVGMSPVTFPPGVKDELGTEKLFKSMLGKVYTVRGFDRYGNVEIQPKRLITVWVEPEFLRLRARKRKAT